MSTEETISVEVGYALEDKQALLTLQVLPGTTALQAVQQSGIAERFPQIDPLTAKMGIFSQMLGTKGLPGADSYALKNGDRVEIYRELIADPKEVRKQRAAKSAK